MEVGSMVSRRTRSKSEAYYRRLHHAIKNPRSIKHDQENNFKESWETREIDVINVEDDDDDDDDVISANDDDDEEEEEETKKKKRKYVVAKKRVGRPPKKARARKQLDFGSLLEGDENMGFVRENVELGDDHALPFKFKFGDDEQQPKTQWEMEIDHLFDDLELGLWESAAPNESDSCVLSDDDECSDVVDESPAARCSRNDHDQFLDEEIGIICRFCHTLVLEIKHVLPSFCVESQSPEREMEREKTWEEEDSKNFEYPIQDCGNLEHTSTSSRNTGTVFDLIPTSSKELYPHQLEGLEFMWRNIAGDIDLDNLQALPRDGGRGCIISHAPGTGKTRLTIVFLQTLLRLYPKCRPLLVAPRGLLLTWAQELTKWDAHIPFHNLNHNPNHNHSQILSWLQGGSILGVGYRLLAQSHQFNDTLLQSSSLVILDEGHTPRNNQTVTWKLLTKLTTRRRIILSGTPFQNNFHELYNTLSLINPCFSHHSNWANLTNSIDEEAISKLREMIKPFIHTHNGTILHKTLPGLQDSLIILKPTPLQQKLLHQNTTSIPNFLQQANLASLISLHPSLVAHHPAFAHHRTHLESLQSDPNSGVKTRFLINLIQISSTLHEKVLIFSDFINPLLHIKKLLKSHLGYKQGREVVYIDGQLSMKQRQSLITSFNDSNGEAKVLLASQRACCEGISLVGASRVVLLDVSWNPSVERQAICRAYRVGQHRMVYVYHLITMMEVEKYARQTQKDRISELLFDTAAAKGDADSCKEGVCEDRVLEAMLSKQGGAAMFERIVYHPKGSDLVSDFGYSFWTF